MLMYVCESVCMKSEERDVCIGMRAMSVYTYMWMCVAKVLHASHYAK